MHAPSSDERLAETKKLLDYGFQNFEVKKVVDSNDILETVDIEKSLGEVLDLYSQDDIFVLSKKADKEKYETQIQIDENLTAPVISGETIGKINVILNGEIIDTKNIISHRDVLKANFKDYFKNIYETIFCV